MAEPITIYAKVPRELAATLKREAKKQHRNLGGLISVILEEWLKARQEKP